MKKMIVRSAMVAVTAGTLAACASQPDELGTQTVSTVLYRSHDCDQIALEMDRVNNRIDALYTSLKKTADMDALQMGIGLVLFWPTLFALEGGDGAEANEYSRLKGERTALEQVSIAKKCGIEMAPLKEDLHRKDIEKENADKT